MIGWLLTWLVVPLTQDICDQLVDAFSDGVLCPFVLDTKRAHSYFVLEWLVDMGFTKLCTDFCAFQQNWSSSMLPVPQRLPFPAAKELWCDCFFRQEKVI